MGRLVMARNCWSHGGAALHGKGARRCPRRPGLPWLLFLLSPRPHCRATPRQAHPTGPQRRPGSEAGAPEATDEPHDKAAERPGPGRAEGSGAAGSGATHPGPQRAHRASPAGLPLSPEEPGAASASLLAGEPRRRSPAPQRLRGRTPFPPSPYWKGHEATTNLHTPQPRKWYGLFPPV